MHEGEVCLHALCIHPMHAHLTPGSMHTSPPYMMHACTHLLVCLSHCTDGVLQGGALCSVKGIWACVWGGVRGGGEGLL